MTEDLNEQLSRNKFGYPLHRRQQVISEAQKEAEKAGKATQRIGNFQGTLVDFPILRIPIELPKYRIANGRTASAQQEWVTTTGKEEDFFDKDPELYQVQEAQHKILSNMVGEEGLQEKFKDTAIKQTEALILDCNGFVINGNRRLSCWRGLYESKPQTYDHFRYVDVIVLPKCEQKEIDELEARLQIERDIKSAYSWHAQATMLKTKQRLNNYTTTELANISHKKKGSR